jgi:hypothetical protein
VATLAYTNPTAAIDRNDTRVLNGNQAVTPDSDTATVQA